MAFSENNMKRLNVGDSAMYVYKSTDSIATVAASGYFNAYSASLQQGDVIMVVDTDATTVDLCAVSSATGAATVTVVNGT